MRERPITFIFMQSDAIPDGRVYRNYAHSYEGDCFDEPEEQPMCPMCGEAPKQLKCPICGWKEPRS